MVVFLVMYMKQGQKFVKIIPPNEDRKKFVMKTERNFSKILGHNTCYNKKNALGTYRIMPFFSISALFSEIHITLFVFDRGRSSDSSYKPAMTD